MPTQSDYRSTAQLLRNQAWSYHDIVGLAPRGPSARITGPGVVASTIDDQYHGVLQQISLAADGLDRAAAECERRADVCGEYRAAINRYWSLPEDARAGTPYPARPAPWAEA